MDEVQALNENGSKRRVWVFAQFNVPEENDKIDSYYYYGKMSYKLYKSISNNKIHQGFIYLDDVKYWGNDDLIHNYADGEHEGDLVFRIEDIRRLKLVKTAPKAGLGSEQFEEPEESVAQ